MKKVLTGILVCLSLFLMTGCGDKEVTIVGTWEYTDDTLTATYIFRDDGKGTYTLTTGDNEIEQKISYVTNNNKIKISFDRTMAPFETEYKIENDVLTIYDSYGSDVEYIRKKD